MKKSKKIPFTEQENIIIQNSVKLIGENWHEISKKLPGRTPKQIHDRYINYLREGLKSDPWTRQEDEILIKMYKIIGPKWTKMMSNLPGRSGNDIKNRWHKHLSKKPLLQGEINNNQNFINNNQQIVFNNQQTNFSNNNNDILLNDKLLVNSNNIVKNNNFTHLYRVVEIRPAIYNHSIPKHNCDLKEFLEDFNPHNMEVQWI